MSPIGRNLHGARRDQPARQSYSLSRVSIRVVGTGGVEAKRSVMVPYRLADIRSSFNLTIFPSLRWYKRNSWNQSDRWAKTFHLPVCMRLSMSIRPASTLERDTLDSSSVPVSAYC